VCRTAEEVKAFSIWDAETGLVNWFASEVTQVSHRGSNLCTFLPFCYRAHWPGVLRRLGS